MRVSGSELLKVNVLASNLVRQRRHVPWVYGQYPSIPGRVRDRGV